MQCPNAIYYAGNCDFRMTFLLGYPFGNCFDGCLSSELPQAAPWIMEMSLTGGPNDATIIRCHYSLVRNQGSGSWIRPEAKMCGEKQEDPRLPD